MADGTEISWCDATFNPWVGCTKVSGACDHCYAEGWAKRTGQPGLWQGDRRRTSEQNWRQPIKWNREAERTGIRKRVFCASLADVFDNQVPAEWRDDLWHMIALTPRLDWLLLTKRPQNIRKMLPLDPVGPLDVKAWGDGWPNVWLGTTAENQEEFDRRWPHLARIPAAVRFISYEPALGPLDLAETFGLYSAGEGHLGTRVGSRWATSPDWVIGGGESGGGARPAHPDWFRTVRDQCVAASVPFHFKQWGEWAPEPEWYADHKVSLPCLTFKDGQITEDGYYDTVIVRVGKKGAGALLDGREWREFPNQPERKP